MNLMNEIASPIPMSSPTNNIINQNKITSSINQMQSEEQLQQNQPEENSKLIINTLLKQITNENKKSENLNAKNNFTENIPVFLYEFFIFELYTPNEIFKTLRQPILAFRLLDFPTLSVEGRLDVQKNLVIFNQGKSSFFEMELGILKDYLTNEPLYVMFIDLNHGDMRIIGSSRVNISIFNNEHFLEEEEANKKNKFEKKSTPKPRRNLLKLFDKSQTVVAEFDVSLLIKREFFKYDSKKEILDKLNIDGNINVNDNFNATGFDLNRGNNGMSLNYPNQMNSGFNNVEFYSQSNFKSDNVNYNNYNNNKNFSNGNFPLQSNNNFFNSNNSNVNRNFHNNNNNNSNNFIQANIPNNFNEDAVDEFIDYNYNQGKSTSGNFLKQANPVSQSSAIKMQHNSNNFQSQSNFKATNQNQRLININNNNNNNNSLNEKNFASAKSIYNPNKENVQSLLNPSQGKSFVHNLKDLLDGGNKQPPPLYFNNKRRNETEEFYAASAKTEVLISGINNNNSNNNSDVYGNSKYNNQFNLNPPQLSSFNFNSENIEKENYAEKFKREKSKLMLNSDNNFNKDIADDFIEHGAEGPKEISSSCKKSSFKAEKSEEILQAKENNEANKNVNLRYDCLQENSEVKNQAENNAFAYIKKPKTIPNREFKDKKQKEEIKLFDKKFENYEAKQKLIGEVNNKSKKQLKDSKNTEALKDDKSHKRINKSNSAYTNEEEENEYIKLYSKIKSDEKLNKIKKDLNKNNKNKSKIKEEKINKRKKYYSESESNENISDEKSSGYTSDSSSSSSDYKRRKKEKKSKSKQKLKKEANNKSKSKNKHENEKSFKSNEEEKEEEKKARNKNKSKVKKDSKKKKQKNLKDDSVTESEKEYFLDYKGTSKNKIGVEKAIRSNENKFRKSFSEKIKYKKASDESISFEEFQEKQKTKNNKEEKKNVDKLKSDVKYKTPAIEKKEKYNFRNNEEDSRMLMSSNNYIKTESILETQMRKLDKNQGTTKNQNYEISNSNAFTINTHQMSNLLKSNNSNNFEKLKEKEQLILKNLEIKSENSINIMSNKNSIKEEITDNINYISNKSISNISEEKIYNNNYNNRKKSKDFSHKKSFSSSNSKNMKFNNLNINKSENTIEEESNLNINNKSNLSRKHLMLQQKSGLSNNSNITEDYKDLLGNGNKVKSTTEDNYDDYGQFDFDYNTSNNSKIIPSNSNFIDEEIIEEDIR